MTAAAELRDPRTTSDPAAGAADGAPAPARHPARSGVEFRSVRRPMPPRPLPARPASVAPSGLTAPAGPSVRPVPGLLPAAGPGAAIPLQALRGEPPPAWKQAVLPRQRRSGPSVTAHLVAAGAVTLVLIGGLGWLSRPAGAELPQETAIVRVGAGETVWDVAQRVAPSSDPQAVVARIRQLNGLVGSAVEPGQQLEVPDGR